MKVDIAAARALVYPLASCWMCTTVPCEVYAPNDYIAHDRHWRVNNVTSRRPDRDTLERVSKERDAAFIAEARARPGAARRGRAAAARVRGRENVAGRAGCHGLDPTRPAAVAGR